MPGNSSAMRLRKTPPAAPGGASIAGVAREVRSELRAASRTALGDHDQGVRLATPVRIADRVCDGPDRRRHLGDGDCLRATRDRGHEREVATVATHHLDEERAMRWNREPRAVQRDCDRQTRVRGLGSPRTIGHGLGRRRKVDRRDLFVLGLDHLVHRVLHVLRRIDRPRARPVNSLQID